MIDVIHLDLVLTLGEKEHVLDRGDQIIGAERHLRLGDRKREFAVDAEAPDAAETVAIGVLEFLVEQGPGLVEGRGIARPKPLVDADEGILMAGRDAGTALRFVGILAEAIHDERHLLLVHHFHSRKARCADQFSLIVRDLAAGLDDDLAGPLVWRSVLVLGGINDVVDRDSPLDFGDVTPAVRLYFLRLIEELEDLGVVGVLLVHGPKERQRGKLSALVDPHLERVFLRNIELDPAPAFWNDPAVVGFAIARFGVGDEVDTGRAVQLADDDTFRTVDDELTATEHDGDVAEIDLFLNGLVARQSQPHAQRATIGEAQLAALIGIVARLPQLVADILELHGAIVALDREDFPQNTLDPLVLPLQRRGVVLEEAVVKAGLDFG